MRTRFGIAAVAIVAAASLPFGAAQADPPPSPTPEPHHAGEAPGPDQPPASAPEPGPKTSFGDGTYTVGTDIAPGVYQSAGPVDGGTCYWKRANGDGIVANAMSKKPQTVQIQPGDTTFKTTQCQEWQKTDAPPPAQPGPGEILSQLGPLIGQAALAPAGR